MRHRHALAAGAAVFALVAVASWSAWLPDAAVAARPGGVTTGGGGWAFLALAAAALAAYVAGLGALVRRAARPGAVLLAAAAIQLVPVTAPLLLSTDAWTYWSYGWIGAEGGANPYRDSPATVPGNPALPYMGAAWVDTTTVYGPDFTAASEPLAWVADGSADRAAWTYKLLAGVAAVAAAALAGGVSRRRALAIAFVGWNPVLAIHLGGGGHNDAWVGALVVGALALAARRRLDGAGALWALAVLVKWVPLLFLALRAVESRATGRAVAHRGFAFTAAASLGLATLLYGTGWLAAIPGLADNAALETGYAIPSRLEQAGLPHAAALGVAALAAAGGLGWLVLQARRGRARLGLAACLVLVTTPYLAVWYLGWAVPVVAADEDRVASVGCLLLCAYLLPQTVPL